MDDLIRNEKKTFLVIEPDLIKCQLCHSLIMETAERFKTKAVILEPTTADEAIQMVKRNYVDIIIADIKNVDTEDFETMLGFKSVREGTLWILAGTKEEINGLNLKSLRRAEFFYKPMSSAQLVEAIEHVFIQEAFNI